MKTIEVGCAVVIKQNKLLIAQRLPGQHLSGFWEFPGGKREAGETFGACLVRELNEELGMEIRPRRFLWQVDHHYPARTVELHFYLCDWVSGAGARHKALDFHWAGFDELRKFRFVPADTEVINRIFQRKSGLW